MSKKELGRVEVLARVRSWQLRVADASRPVRSSGEQIGFTRVLPTPIAAIVTVPSLLPMDRSISPAVPAKGVLAGRKRILIVDDHAAVLKVLRISLEHHGFIVCGEAKSGIDAIATAVATRPDLVILDVAMPGLNGIEVASVLQRLLPDLPMILHTIYGDNVGRSFGAVFGIRAVVAKTDGINKLIDCVHSVLKSAPESDQP